MTELPKLKQIPVEMQVGIAKILTVNDWMSDFSKKVEEKKIRLEKTTPAKVAGVCGLIYLFSMGT